MEKYNFGLTNDQKDLADKLHSESIVIDMLCQGPIGIRDIPNDTVKKIESIANKVHPNDEIARVSFSSNLINEYGLNGDLSKLYDDIFDESGLTGVCRQLDISDFESLYRSSCIIQKEFDYKPNLIKVLKSEDIEFAKSNGKIAGIVTSQSTIGFGKDLSLLKSAYDFGLRLLQLSYNNHNLVGAGCMEPNDAGLSVFGIKFVKELNKLGIVVDTGHCGKNTTLDACKYSDKPVVASHTSAQGVNFHERGKSDEEIKAIAKTGGVIGIFAMPWFTAKDHKNTTIDHVLDHIDYVVNLVGDDYVGIGTDWPMPQTEWMALTFKKYIAPTMGFAVGDGPSIETIDGLDSYRDFSNFTHGLLSRGYGEESIKKIIGGNWLRVFKEIF